MAEEKEVTYFDIRKPCNDCPFRRQAMRGWLGPYGPDEVLDLIRYEPFPCHQTIHGDDVPFDDEALRGCAGAAIYLNNTCEMSRCGDTLQHQRDLKSSEHSEDVFNRPDEFVQHHDRANLIKGEDDGSKSRETTKQETD